MVEAKSPADGFLPFCCFGAGFSFDFLTTSTFFGCCLAGFCATTTGATTTGAATTGATTTTCSLIVTFVALIYCQK